MSNWLSIKRSCDVIFSLAAICFLLPFWIVIAAVIWLEDRGPIFYTQKRVGKNTTLFTLYKFRSMRVNHIPPLALGAIKHNHSMVTRIGYFIRRFKLDETPQFLNVLLGEMSLIGPRPCLPERLPTMSLNQKKRFHYLPGLTGWAEVNGNVELSWEEQIALDIWYGENKSALLECYIFFKTIIVVFLGSSRNEKALRHAMHYLKE